MEKQKINFHITISAPKEKVWKVLLDDKTYRQWCSVFMEGSYAETDWQEGSKALFMGPDRSGMSSRIVKHTPNEVLTIEHRGVIQNGVENFENEEAHAWRGTKETYRVKEENGQTHLEVDQDVTDEYKDYFEKTWKTALQKVKELSEA